MFAMTEPLVSFSATSAAISQIRSELKSFGLNPRDWQSTNQRGIRSRLILVHREDKDLRLAVVVQRGANSKARITDVEMLVN